MRVRHRSVYLGVVALLTIHQLDSGAIAQAQTAEAPTAAQSASQLPSIAGSSKRLPRALSVPIATEPTTMASASAASLPAFQPGSSSPVNTRIMQVAHEQPVGSVNADQASFAPPAFHGNASIPLQPMVPVQSGISLSPMLPSVNTPTAPGAISLQPMVSGAQTPTHVAGLPFAVLPMTRYQSSDTPMSAKTQLNVQAMTGPMADPLSMFGQLETQTPAPGPLAAAQRTDSSYVPWMQSTYTWYTPTFAHRPLYFEQPNLERYGIGTYRWLQPAASSAHFFTSIGLMPYKVLTQHPREKVYTLGYDRPGNCAAYQGRPVLGQSYVGEIFKYWDSCSGYQ